jgi:hypothetical protein
MEANALGIYRDGTAEMREIRERGLSAFAVLNPILLARSTRSENLLKSVHVPDVPDSVSNFGDHGQSFSEFPPSGGVQRPPGPEPDSENFRNCLKIGKFQVLWNLRLLLKPIESYRTLLNLDALSVTESSTAATNQLEARN